MDINTLYNEWLEKADADPDLKVELENIKGNDDEILDRFYRSLEFGTAGLRGVIGAGTNRMNVYTVGRATQGLADYLNDNYDSPSVAIGYDSRIKSDYFSRESAEILAANGIKVYIYDELEPTPCLSYAVRKLKASGGIIITASHNPAKYNGYKCYNSKGYQMTDDEAAQTYEYIKKVDYFTGIKKVDFDSALSDGKIEYIGEKLIESFLDEVQKQCINPDIVRKADLKVIYTLEEGDDWQKEESWYKANPSLGITVPIERFREAYQIALENPAEENYFKTYRLNTWGSNETSWLPDNVFMKGNLPIDLSSLRGRSCYAGLDLSSTTDISALVLLFPPESEDDCYYVLPYFWLPEDTIQTRFRHAGVQYPTWKKQGYLYATPGNVVDYAYIRSEINRLGTLYNILEIGADPWNATQLLTELSQDGFTVISIRQNYAMLSPPTKEFYKLMLEGKLIHGGNPVLRWMASNVIVESDSAGNIKPSKKRAKEKIDGIVASIMALDRCIRNQGVQEESVYDSRDLLIL